MHNCAEIEIVFFVIFMLQPYNAYYAYGVRIYPEMREHRELARL